MSSLARARLWLLAAAVLFSTGGAAIKACSLSAWQVACLRSGIAAVALFAALPSARRSLSPRVGPAGVAYAATLVLFVTANKLTTSANAIFLQSTAPLYLLLLSPWLLRERFARRDLGVVALVGAGLVACLQGEHAPLGSAPDPMLGNALALASGLCWALTLASLRWLGRSARAAGRDPALGAVLAGNAIACAVALVPALPLHALSSGDTALIGYLGVFQIGVAYVCVTRGLREVPALEAALILLVEPALNPLWAYFAQHEVPSAWSIAGGISILSATLLKTWLDARASARAPS